MRFFNIFSGIFLLIFFLFSPIKAEENLAKKLSGKILLQVESHGEAWYVNPGNLKKYYLGRPDDAFLLMKKLGIGITDSDLLKIPLGLLHAATSTNDTGKCNSDKNDSDGDCLPDKLELALKTDPTQSDSDGDGYDDKTEMLAGFNPSAVGAKLLIDMNFVRQNAGKIFLQVQGRGEAWYINPEKLKRYYLGTPANAWEIMKKLGLGISNTSLQEITADSLTVIDNTGWTPPKDPATTTTPTTSTSTAATSSSLSASEVFAQAASAIRAKQDEKALAYFTPEIKERVRYSLKVFDDDSRLAFANTLSAAKQTAGDDNEKTFSAKTYFDLGGYEITLKFTIKKQADGTWLIASL